MIPVYKPFLPPGALSQAHQALDSTWLSSQGKYIQMAQEKLQELLQVKYVLPLNNGTSACHLVAKILHKKYEQWYHKKMTYTSNGEKISIIVPNNVYVAAWNSFLFDQDYELIPIDANMNTWNIDLDLLDVAIKTHPQAAVLIVHNMGNVINVPQLQIEYPNTLFVEDNCEGFLGTYSGMYSGTASVASAISFFGNKNITSGEGGALIVNSEEDYLLAKCIQGQGQSDKRFIHSMLGYNYRMTNIQAAILCGQLDLLPTIMNLKNQLFETYTHAFGYRQDITIQTIEPNTTHSNWMFGVRVPGCPAYEHTETYFKSHGIEIRPMFYPINEHTHLMNHPDIWGSYNDNARLLSKECFILPSFPDLTYDEVSHIIKTVNLYLKEIQPL